MQRSSFQPMGERQTDPQPILEHLQTLGFEVYRPPAAYYLEILWQFRQTIHQAARHQIRPRIQWARTFGSSHLADLRPGGASLTFLGGQRYGPQ
jgi:hypothetical protein